MSTNSETSEASSEDAVDLYPSEFRRFSSTRTSLPKGYTLGEYIARGSFGSIYEVSTDPAVAPADSGLIVKIGAYPIRAKHFDNEYHIISMIMEKVRDNTKIAARLPQVHEYFSTMSYDVERRQSNVYVCMVMKRYYESIGSIIDTLAETNEREVGLNLAAVQNIMRQILETFDWLHKNSIIHGDVSPSNILLARPNDKCTDTDLDVAIIDFGSSNVHNYNIDSYVTRMYRPPELTCENSQYNEGVDIWEIGCVFFELLTGSDLFNFLDDADADTAAKEGGSDDESDEDSSSSYYGYTGGWDSADSQQYFTDNLNHLWHISCLLGAAPKEFRAELQNCDRFYTKNGLVKDTKPIMPRNIVTELETKYKFTKQRATMLADFLLRMIRYVPSGREKPEQLLKHRFFKEKF